ncbi:hypothetical protein CLAFUW4_03657 [Fulvia fulva]|nr:hypothetical protein CLAFUR4_03645 [Fulvia fulva]WPV11214.1 hypothetical protein CLAFUW4_03657 [Fulvia fulva]WPV25617.1 hypothetical protein CLAFUW7_03649 [Fulvia fulva]
MKFHLLAATLASFATALPVLDNPINARAPLPAAEVERLNEAINLMKRGSTPNHSPRPDHPHDPTDSTDPTDPTNPTDPTDPIDSHDPDWYKHAIEDYWRKQIEEYLRVRSQPRTS